MNTDDLVRELARDVRPVAPLPRASRRTVFWVAGTALYLAVLGAVMTSAADLEANGGSWVFLLPQLAALLTGILAAGAALASVVPGATSRMRDLALVAAGAWTLTLAIPAWSELGGPGRLSGSVEREWMCVVAIVLGGALPGGILAAMLKRGAPMSPRMTAALAALAAGALANVTACFSHPHVSGLTTLVWHGTTLAVLVAIASRAGTRIFRWERVSFSPTSG
jgi:hypothetical protein